MMLRLVNEAEVFFCVLSCLNSGCFSDIRFTSDSRMNSKKWMSCQLSTSAHIWSGCHILDFTLKKRSQVFALFTCRRRYQWWVKISPYLSPLTRLQPLSPRQTWLRLAHRTTGQPTKSTPCLHSRSGSTSQCGSMSRENMSTWTDPGRTWETLVWHH